jgi:hypothetical protein
MIVGDHRTPARRPQGITEEREPIPDKGDRNPESYSLPAALQNEADLAASGLHDIEACLAPELKEAERIVLALLSNCRRVIVATLNDHAVIVDAPLA